MRYFYDCLLKAAMMAKYFGMRFQVKHTYSEEMVDAAGVHPDCETRLFIHPDSLHVLNPRTKDVCKGQSGWDDGVFIMKGDGDINHLKNIHSHIIQRNGMAFIWPEVEA